MSIEYGVWSDAVDGFVEVDLRSLGGAETALIDHRREDPTVRIREVCSDHEEQPADACEDCDTENEEG